MLNGFLSRFDNKKKCTDEEDYLHIIMKDFISANSNEKCPL